MGSPLDKCPVHDEGGGHGGAQGDGDGSSLPTLIATAKMMSSVVVMGPAGLKKAPPPQAAPVLPPPSMEVVAALDEQEEEPLLLGNDDNDDGAPPGPAGSHLPGAAVPAVAAALLELGPQSPSRNVDDDLPAPCACPLAMENKEKSLTYLRHVTCSKTKQAIQEPQVSLLKFKGIPGTDSLVHEAPRTNLTHTTSFHFEKALEEPKVSSLNFKGIPGTDSLVHEETRTNLTYTTIFAEATEENRDELLLNDRGIPSVDPLCDYGNTDVNKSAQAVQSINIAKNLTQLFVKVCQKKVSLQADFNSTTIKELIKYACCKARIKACDFYATYAGKSLKAEKPIAYYPIFKDSTVYLRPRLRAAGRMVEYKSLTFEELMSKKMDNRFHQVTLSQLSINAKKQRSSVTFLSQFSAYYIHKIMVYICGKHREGKSFDGKFRAKDILIINNTMVDFDCSNLWDFPFNEDSCSNDYATLYNIFTTYFIEAGQSVPLYFGHFLNYLFACPAKAQSNSEPLIQFLTNHPALTSYMDRIKQCNLLDSMARRVNYNDKLALNNSTSACPFASWVTDVQYAPALNKVYLYGSIYDIVRSMTIVNSEYTAKLLGCLRFSRNYFNHTDYQMKLEEAEAAFAEALEDFLPLILLYVAKDFAAPTHFDILTLLGTLLQIRSSNCLSQIAEDPQ